MPKADITSKVRTEGAPRALRKTMKDKPKTFAKGGRPKGSVVDKRWGLTAGQMILAQTILDVETTDGFFPSSITELARKTKTDRHYLREMLRREKFQRYLNHLMTTDGIMLEISFWRGMQLGLQVGDPKVLQLYANITGKVQKREMPVVKVKLVGPGGEEFALPMYTDDPNVIDAEVIEEFESEG